MYTGRTVNSLTHKLQKTLWEYQNVGGSRASLLSPFLRSLWSKKASDKTYNPNTYS